MSRHSLRRYVSDHPGHPLGKGMPMGQTLREDGESHRQAWERVLRNDPCAYCGKTPAGTIDHIVPRDALVSTPAIGGKFSWTNLAGSCESCNGSKTNMKLWNFLWVRHPYPGTKIIVGRLERAA